MRFKVIGYSRLPSCFALLPVLAGCADMRPYNRLRYDVPGIGETTFVDAKQRAVFAVAQPVVTANGTAWSTRICAEPSPDALAAIAAAGSGGISIGQKANAQAAFSAAETAANIGLRTQSIQLMRDAMYRMCEGVASGTLSQVQFETLFRRFQNSMVAILAIEQLTGVVKGPNAQLSTTGSVGAAKEVAELAENTAKAQDASAAADADAKAKAKTLADATAKRDAYLKTNGVTQDTLSDAQKTEFAPLQQAVTDATTANAAAVTAATEAKEKLAIYQAGMQAVHGGDLAAGGTAASGEGAGGPLDASTAATIAQAVQAIVVAQFDMGFFRDACATLFDAEIEGRVSPQAATLQANCDAFARVTIANSVKQMDSAVLATSIEEAAAAKYSADYGAYLLKWGGGAESHAPPPPGARHASPGASHPGALSGKAPPAMRRIPLDPPPPTAPPPHRPPPPSFTPG